MFEGQSPAASSPDLAAPRSPDLPASTDPRVELLLPYKVSKKRWTEYFDRVYLPAILERCQGNVSKAAREAQLDRAYLFRMLQRYGLKG